MKKKILCMALVMALLAALLLTACGKTNKADESDEKLFGGLELELPSAAATDPWMGLWRSTDDDGTIGLYHFKDDGTFKLMAFYPDGTDVAITGKYKVAGGEVIISERMYNGKPLEGEDALPIKVTGDTMSISGVTCTRVPEGEVMAVLANPRAPYPAGTVAAPTSGTNLVDERYELIALILRLAGRPEFDFPESEYSSLGEDFLNYHGTLLRTFSAYKNHPAVVYAATLNISSSDFFTYSLYIKEDLSGLAEDLGHLTASGGLSGTWTEETVQTFWSHVQSFYNDTGFAEFYRSHIPFYESISAPFFNDQRVSKLDTGGWFTSVAKRYERSTPKMRYYRYFVSPSLYEASESAWDNDTAYGVMVAGLGQMESWQISSDIIHEWCHSFCNPTAIDALMTNAEFQAWVEDTHPGFQKYDDELIISVEYVVRAYTMLYFADHGDDEVVSNCLERDKALGFTHIEEVYQWVQRLEGKS